MESHLCQILVSTINKVIDNIFLIQMPTLYFIVNSKIVNSKLQKSQLGPILAPSSPRKRMAPPD